VTFMMPDNKEQRFCVKFCFLLMTVQNLVRQSGSVITSSSRATFKFPFNLSPPSYETCVLPDYIFRIL
jgi:hypothetical protein